MKESVFQRETKKSIENGGYFCEKFPDGIKTGMTRFIPEKPFDLIACINGVTAGIECKMLWNKSIEKFCTSMIISGREKKDGLMYYEGHQYKSLMRLEKSGGRGFVFLNHRLERISNVLYILTLTDIDSISMIEHEKPALVEYLKTNCYHSTGHKGMYDLTKFYTEVTK